jgi:hypothetical protein
MNLDEIKESMRERAAELATFLFPTGKMAGREWQIGDVSGSPGSSLSICTSGLKAGVWKDWSTGETGTLLDLWAMRHGYHGGDGWVAKAGEECASWLGGQFEKRQKDGTTAPAATNGSHPAPARPRVASPPPRPTPRVKPAALPAMPSYADEWQKCVEAMTSKALAQLCEQRGFSLEFGGWLVAQGLIGLHETRHGLALALPVHDESGAVIAAHVRNRQKDAAGNPIDPPPPKWQYRYHGEQSPGTRPLIIGDIAKASKLYTFESQWDAFAVIDRLGLHRGEAEWPPIAFFITRGASNAAILARYITEGRALILWPQNDQPTEAGKIPAEEWVKSIVSLAGSVPCRRVATPKEYEDPNDWLNKDREAGAIQLFEAISQAVPARTTKLPPMRDMAFAIRPENRSPVPPEVIKGILHRGSKMVIGGTSKGRKSFSLLDLAVAVATGGKWWGFDCNQGRVLYLNFEIQQPFLEARVFDITQARETTVMPGYFQSISLRGSIETVEDLAKDLIAYILDLEPFAMIIFDPVYKLMAGKDENKAGDVGTIMAHLERVSVETGAAIVFGAHYSKGNQSAKESIDRIGGSGVFARDPDAILTMTGHEVENAFTVEATLRNYKPIDPFVVGWQYPLFSRDDSGLDPAALKMPPGKKGEKEKGGDRWESGRNLRKNDRLLPALELLRLCYTEVPRAVRMYDATRKAVATMFDGLGNPLKEDTAKKYFYKLKDDGYIVKDSGSSNWITTKLGDDYLDAQAAKDSAEPTTEPTT